MKYTKDANITTVCKKTARKNSKQYCYFFFFLVQYNKYEEKGGNQNEIENAIWNK